MTNRQTPNQELNETEEVAWELLATREHVAAGEVAAARGVTRQAALHSLRKMTQGNLLERVGAGRGTRYRRRADFVGSWPIEGLQEEVVWREVVAGVPAFADAIDNVRHILNYALTEMVNNAIDHSRGSSVRVVAWTRPWLSFEVADDGVGAFAHMRDERGLPDVRAAVEVISKGKQTTDPTRHSGQGIFFTSKSVDRFDLRSNGLRWLVDNARRDQAIGEALPAKGTVVTCSIAADSPTQLEEVFAGFTDEEHAFSRSRVVLRLFERGEEFVSRSEAKRLAASLDEFREVEVDFAGVTMVGQGFSDELFRVWATAHPGTRLIPINMSETVRWQVDLARTN
jgi:anti-sigma regulatory factor (Ser/Thr protein kinase)